MKRVNGVILLIFLGCCGPLEARQQGIFSHHAYPKYSRIVISIEKEVPVELRILPRRFELHLSNLRWSDFFSDLLSLPANSFPVNVATDSRLSSLEWSEVPTGIQLVGRWKFPTGHLALAQPEMKVAAYWRKSPSAYVVDFWLRPGPTRIQFESEKKRISLLKHEKNLRLAETMQLQQKTLHEKQKLQEAQWTHFCEDPSNEQNEIFLKFLPVHEFIRFSHWLPSQFPDQGYQYFKPSTEDPEAHYVQKALNFYAAGRSALTLRTLDFFQEQFQNSKFSNQMEFLRANAQLKLGLKEPAGVSLEKLTQQVEPIDVAIQAAMYLAEKRMHHQEYLKAIQKFEWLLRYCPKHPLSWVFHLGMAESFYALGNLSEALKEYRLVLETSSDKLGKAEAALRMGDLYLARFEYEEALAIYSQNWSYVKNQAHRFPAFFLNRGEVLYQLGKWVQAQDVFQEFLRKNPYHPEGWRALFRLGEIFGKRAFVLNNQSKARSLYYQTINRYPQSPGATLARMGLIPCGDHAGFSLAAQEHFFAVEAKKFNPKESISMKNYPDYLGLSHINALLTQAKPRQIVEGGMLELSQVKSPNLRKKVIQIVNHFFRKELYGLIHDGKKYEAMSFYIKNKDQIPLEEVSNDLSYLLLLSQIASDYGLGRLGMEILNRYEKLNASGDPKNKIVLYSEQAKKNQDSEVPYIKASSLWVQSQPTLGDTSVDHKKEFSQIKELLAQVSDGSKFSYFKELILGLLDEQENQFESAIQHAAHAQLSHPSLQVQSWIIRLYGKAGKNEIAFHLYDELEKSLESKVIQKKEDSKEMVLLEEERLIGIPFVPQVETIILEKGKILEQQKQWGEAAQVYFSGIKRGFRSDQMMYSYAKMLIISKDQLEKKKGLETLEKLVQTETQTDPGKMDPGKKSSTESFWKKLAKETLENQKIINSTIQ